MLLVKMKTADGYLRLGVSEGDDIRLLDMNQVDGVETLADILHSPDPVGLTKFLISKEAVVAASTVRILAPIDRQEVWAAGVTYKRSQVARMEESEAAASHYDKVYTADRPELFFKATPSRVSGPGEPVRVRFDSDWSVPEPEFALIITPDGRITGYTIGNDMSARDIEGENPLYLPQAKFYADCCSLGPYIRVASGDMSLGDTKITLRINRDGQQVFEGETDLSSMARSFEDLTAWLMRENAFPDGVILLTGTGIVPPDDFSLEHDDHVSIEVSDIGTLANPVVKSAQPR